MVLTCQIVFCRIEPNRQNGPESRALPRIAEGKPTPPQATCRQSSPCPASDVHKRRRTGPQIPDVSPKAHRSTTLAEWTHRKRSNRPVQPLPPPDLSRRAAPQNARHSVSCRHESSSWPRIILNTIIRPVMHHQLIGRKKCIFDARTRADLARRLRFDVLPGPVVPVLCRRRVTLRY